MIEAVPLENTSFEAAICQISGGLNEYARISSLLWTTVFAYSLYTVLQTNTLDMRLFRRSIWLCFIFPLIFSLIPLMLGVYGNAVLFCWIEQLNNTTENEILDTLFFYGWFPVILVINTVYYCKAISLLRRSIPSDQSKTTFYQLLFYPLILCVCWSVGFVDRYFIAEKGVNSVPLRTIHVVMIQLQGFMNALIYGLNYAVRTAIKEGVKEYCGGNSNIGIEEELNSSERLDKGKKNSSGRGESENRRVDVSF